jgi:hypothetical protein
MPLEFESATPVLRFTTPAHNPLQQRKVKNFRETRTDPFSQASYPTDGQWRRHMRALSYIIATVLLLTGPLMAGSAENDLPGIGTFAYSGSPVVTEIPAVMAAVEVGH